MLKDINPHDFFLAALKHETKQKWRGKKKLLASQSDISVPFLSQILHGKKNAGIETAGRLSNVLGYTFEDFIKLGRSLVECGKPNGSNSTDSIPKLNNVHFLPIRKSPEELRRQAMHDRLETIYNSGHTVLISAIESNLVAFSEAVEDKKERNAMLERIKTLEERG
jgi:transcriptional regulator with XRE-family HTH domain